MKFRLQRFLTRLKDNLRHSDSLRNLAARLKLLRPGHSLQRFVRAYELASKPALQRAALKRISPFLDAAHRAHWVDDRVGWHGYESTVRDDPKVSRTLLLKAPEPGGEKGVIFCHFEYNWLRMLSGIEDYQAFTRKYTVIFAASWSPTRYGLLGLTAASTDQPIYIQPANPLQRAKMEAFHPQIRTLDTMTCDWINPDLFAPLPWSERDIDLLVVSNWAPFKRHWELFEILCQLPADLRVVCVGQRQSGVSLDDIRELQARYRVPQDIEYLESIPIEEVSRLQCRAKISALFSRREGGSVAVTESLAGGAVMMMREDAHIGARAHINPATGILIMPDNAAQRITAVLENGDRFDSREWSTRNISCVETTRKINQRLKQDSLAEGLPWTSDIALSCYRPYSMLCNDEDRQQLLPAVEELHELSPKVFPRDMIEISHR